MARRSKKRSPYQPGTKDRRKRPPSHSLVQNSAEYKRRYKGSILAAQIIEAMIDDIDAAVKQVKRELGGLFQVDYNSTPRKGRVNVYLRSLDKWRKHAHLVIKVGAVNQLVSVTHWGRAWTS